MSVAAAQARREGGGARSILRARLKARLAEIEASLLTRTQAIADPREAADPAYAQSLRQAVGAALEYGLATLDCGETGEPPIPVELLAQARLAARNNIALDTVLRRYFAGYSLLGYYLMEEASRDGLMGGAELQRLIGAQSGTLDRLLAAIGEEHARESETLALATGVRRGAERIERLLAGEQVDTSEIPYDFNGCHLGLAAAGAQVEEHLRELTTSVDCRLLLLPREEGTVWAWLGSRRPLDPADVLAALRSSDAEGLRVALGEPDEGLPGWRFTHRQALAALPVALCASERAVLYGDVALVAATVTDDLLAKSLFESYVRPLSERHDAESLMATLSAYFAAEKNISSTAAALDVSRQTVRNRLRTIEDLLARRLSACTIELELALRLARLPNSGFHNGQLRSRFDAELPRQPPG